METSQRAEVLKYQIAKQTANTLVGFANLCRKCGDLVKGPPCEKSHCFAFNCSICNLSVRGKLSVQDIVCCYVCFVAHSKIYIFKICMYMYIIMCIYTGLLY